MSATLFHQVGAYENRANPYPFYAEMRKTPVFRDDENMWIVSRYREIMALLHDPRMSSEPRLGDQSPGPGAPPFLRQDPPGHDRLRRMASRPFGPPHSPGRVTGLEAEIGDFVTKTLAGWEGKTQVDIVDDFAHPLPIMVICGLLGVPPEGEAKFKDWVDAIVLGLDAASSDDAKGLQRTQQQATGELAGYLAGLVGERRKEPRDDMLSALATDGGPDGTMTDEELLKTAILLLIAGHETTVNLIANAMLTLLRFPEHIDRLRAEPSLVVPLVEEVLRYEPPVQFLPGRSTKEAIPIDGVVIPKDSRVVLVLASANRDPARFDDADAFIPDRPDNQHLGFGSGIHNCFGSPLARIEAQRAITALVDALDNPRLVADPPEYRQPAVLRGPLHLEVAFDGLRG